MPETPTPDGTKRGLEELARLKHDVDKSIPYGKTGLNAKQIAELHRMSAEDWAAVRLGYHGWIKPMRSFGTLTLFVVAAVGVGAWSYFGGWVGIVGLVFAIYAAVELCKREGHREGYMDGYDAGFERGVNKAIGLSDEEAMEAQQMATEIQIDENMVSAFDKRAERSKDVDI